MIYLEWIIGIIVAIVVTILGSLGLICLGSFGCNLAPVLTYKICCYLSGVQMDQRKINALCGNASDTIKEVVQATPAGMTNDDMEMFRKFMSLMQEDKKKK